MCLIFQGEQVCVCVEGSRCVCMSVCLCAVLTRPDNGDIWTV